MARFDDLWRDVATTDCPSCGGEGGSCYFCGGTGQVEFELIPRTLEDMDEEDASGYLEEPHV